MKINPIRMCHVDTKVSGKVDVFLTLKKDPFFLFFYRPKANNGHPGVP